MARDVVFWRWAHPRSRGDHPLSSWSRRTRRGSSPLARGPPFPSTPALRRVGLIPARAGTTSRSCRRATVERAHPRSRGDHHHSLKRPANDLGSSPLARGPQRPTPGVAGLVGLIPARAGTTLPVVGMGGVNGAHPRSRGDHATSCASSAVSAGSSPLARGPRGLHLLLLRRPGLIPARAGTTGQGDDYRQHQRAHPRSRGDHKSRRFFSTRRRGSSPLARGPRRRRLHRVPCGGLIPARAGTTQTCRRPQCGYGAHPRSRGDHGLAEEIVNRISGSSPLARGPRGCELAVEGSAGLIPARAGTTSSPAISPRAGGAHPRSRGDHVRVHPVSSTARGSSPLARGPLGLFDLPWQPPGLIPARAGTTLADMGFYPLHQQNRITLKPEPKSRIHDKQQLLTTTSTAIPARLTPP